MFSVRYTYVGSFFADSGGRKSATPIRRPGARRQGRGSSRLNLATHKRSEEPDGPPRSLNTFYDCLFPTIAGGRLRAFTGIRIKNQAACVMLGAKVEHID